MNYKRLFLMTLTAFALLAVISGFITISNHDLRTELRNSVNGVATGCPEAEAPECPTCKACPSAEECPQTPIEQTLALKGQCIPSWEWRDHPELDKRRDEILELAAKRYPSIVKGIQERNAESRKDYQNRVAELDAVKKRGQELKKVLPTPLTNNIEVKTSASGVRVQIDKDCMPRRDWYSDDDVETQHDFSDVSDLFAFAEAHILAKPEDENDKQFSKQATDQEIWRMTGDFLLLDFLPEPFRYYGKDELLAALEHEHLLRRDASGLIAVTVEITKNPLIKWFFHKELREFWKASNQNWSKLQTEAKTGKDIHSEYGRKVSFLYRRWWSQRDAQVGNDLIALYRLYFATLAKRTGLKEANAWVAEAKKDVRSSSLRWKKTHLALLR